MRYENNPANIRFSPINNWKGQISPCNGFCQFTSITYGLRALIILLRGYIKRGYDTPEKIISRFAPASENNTSAYLSYVCRKLECRHDTPIKFRSFRFAQLVAAICFYETNFSVTNYLYGLTLKTFNL